MQALGSILLQEDRRFLSAPPSALDRIPGPGLTVPQTAVRTAVIGLLDKPPFVRMVQQVATLRIGKEKDAPAALQIDAQTHPGIGDVVFPVHRDLAFESLRSAAAPPQERHAQHTRTEHPRRTSRETPDTVSDGFSDFTHRHCHFFASAFRQDKSNATKRLPFFSFFAKERGLKISSPCSFVFSLLSLLPP